MEAFSALALAIRAMTGMVADLVPDESRMRRLLATAMPPRPISPIGWCGR